MILGFIIVEKLGFISFEHYFDNFQRFINSKSDFFSFFDNTGYELGNYEFEKVGVEICEASDQILVAVIYQRSKSLNPQRKEKLLSVALDVSKGDKSTTHNVLKSKYASDILEFL